jgi:hypothetical protein
VNGRDLAHDLVSQAQPQNALVGSDLCSCLRRVAHFYGDRIHCDDDLDQGSCGRVSERILDQIAYGKFKQGAVSAKFDVVRRSHGQLMAPLVRALAIVRGNLPDEVGEIERRGVLCKLCPAGTCQRQQMMDHGGAREGPRRLACQRS